MFFFYSDKTKYAVPDVFYGLEQSLSIIMKHKPTMSLSVVRLFILIALNSERMNSPEGMSLADLAEELGVPYGTLGRQLDLLEKGYGNTLGLGWIERGIDERQPKMRRVRLTDLGWSVAYALEAALRDKKPRVRVAEHRADSRQMAD